MSDDWRAYDHIRFLGMGYRHLTVNHSENFVDPNTGAHINSIEGYWGNVKAKLKVMRGTRKDMLSWYLKEFMWRQEFADCGHFDGMLQCIANQHRV